MPSIVISRLVGVALLSMSASAAASSSDKPPRSLTVPVLGLRLPLAQLNVDKFPDAIRSMCDQIADERYTAQMWVFAKAKDAATTYYLLGGYYKWHDPGPNRRQYDIWDNGGVFIVQGNKCGGDDALDTFSTHDPNADNDGNVPDRVLRELARDLAVQTVRTFGGPERLRAEIKRQRIDFNQLPPDLQQAFKPYFEPAK